MFGASRAICYGDGSNKGMWLRRDLRTGVIRFEGCAWLYPFMLDLTKLEQAEWAKAKGMTLKEFSRWFKAAAMADADRPRQARRGRRAKKYQIKPPAKRKPKRLSQRLSQQERRIRYFEENPGEVKSFTWASRSTR